MLRFPPSPKSKLDPNRLENEEKKGTWIAQRKFNGQRNLIHVLNGKVELWNRHGVRHRNYKPDPILIKQILSLNLDPTKEYWLDGELLAAKPGNKEFKGTIVLFDIIQAGKYLYGINQMERLQILNDICRNPQILCEAGFALKVTSNIWLAENFVNDFEGEFQRFIDHDVIEGLVLRDKNAVLDNLGTAPYEVNWIIRVRKPHKNYGF